MCNYPISDFIGLAPFDPTMDDKGVQTYLDVHGFVPSSVILGAFWYEELEQFQIVDDEVVAVVKPDVFREKPFYWTRQDIADLVARLKMVGVKVYLGICSHPYQLSFSRGMQSFVAGERRRDWMEAHRELVQLRRTGETTDLPAINLLKRERNGQFFEDRFIQMLIKTLKGYGFDGYCAGDGALGLRGPKETLDMTDFSDDMISQFVDYSKIILPTGSRAELAEFILRNHRGEWSEFWRWRWLQHVTKLAARLAEKGLDMVAVDAWSRNPVDMIYDYGVDYSLLQVPGFSRVLVQSREANKWRKHREGTYVTEEASILTLLGHKIRAPKISFDWFMTLVNRIEYWNAIHDLPQVVERENFCFNTLARFVNGRFQPVIDGFTVQGYPTDRADWDWCMREWNAAVSLGQQFAEALGLTLVWSEKFIDNILAGEKPWVTERFRTLINGGVGIHSVCLVEEMANVPTQGFIAFAEDKWASNATLQGLKVLMKPNGLVVDGQGYSYEDGIEVIKGALRFRCSQGRIYGFKTTFNDYIIGIENPSNLFYAHIDVELPFEIGMVRPLPPRHYYLVDGSVQGNRFQVSCPPDGCIMVRVTRKEG